MITPLIWVFLMLALALLTKNHKRKWRRICTAAALLFLFSNTALFRVVSSAYVSHPGKSVYQKHYTAGIVLGGMAAYNNYTKEVVFNKAGDRLAKTLRLYRAGVINKIIISGGSGSPFIEERKESEVLREYLIGLNVPENDILIENKSRNTYENALYTAELIKKDSLAGSFLLITSALHLPRAQKCFATQKIPVDIHPANFEYGTPLKLSDFLIPKPETLGDWESLMHELVGTIAYRLAGYID